ncbi:putative fungal lipase-like domain, alpha/Beta hydrolase [Plasmopara halstedii]
MYALLLLQPLTITINSTKSWQYSFPFDQVQDQISTLWLASNFDAITYNETTAQYLAHVTSVSYCQAKHIVQWNCQPCAFVQPMEGVTVVEDTKDNFQGLVGYSKLYDAVVIAFRGSMDITNWIDNLTFHKLRAYAEFPSVLVHEGFYWAYRSVAPQVLDALHRLQMEHTHASVMVTGHSLGGAVAAVCAFELEYLEKIPVNVLYTFGKPRVGNINFSARLRRANMEVYRVTHFRDVVPHLPPTWLGFEHTTREIFYDQFSDRYRNCSETDGEDPTCSNACSPFSCTSIVDHLTYLNITMSHLIC